MSKRKAVVNDIIYELHNEDLDTSSEDEKEASKKSRLEAVDNSMTINDSPKITEEIVDVVSSDDAISVLSPPTTQQNGGKSPSEPTDTVDFLEIPKDNTINNANVDVSADKETPILNEDIVIDSNHSSPANLPIGCENRTPLISVMFKNQQIAKDYKQKIKEFMLNLIKLHDEENIVETSDESDLVLDIWPEDLDQSQELKEEDDNLFFIDTAPTEDHYIDVPKYSKADGVLSNVQPIEASSPTPLRRGPTCFNCEGPHPLRDCQLPRNVAKITERRNAMNSFKVGRYHVEDEQKYGHLVPGRISGKLRHAMGLKRDQLPLYIYRMRLLGYPPGWLEEARISHSGITMFDSMGKAILDPEEEEGEVSEPGSKDKYDIKKILDYPGFNVAASSRYKEEARSYGLPPISEQDSKLNMLQVLAPNAMMAYKRKKLTFFPSGSPNTTVLGCAEMELDDEDEVAEFPSVPPLPDEAPPPIAPPPPLPPLPPPPLEDTTPPPPPEDNKPPALPTEDYTLKPEEINETIPLPEDETIPLSDDSEQVINISDDGHLKDASVTLLTDDSLIVLDEEPLSDGRDSPSLDYLVKKKQLLLAALESGTPVKELLESATPVEYLSDSGTPVEDLESSATVKDMSESGKPVNDLSDSGTFEKELSDSGTPVKDMSESGTTVKDLSDSGMLVKDTSEGGKNVKDLSENVTLVQDLSDKTNSKDLKPKGIDVVSKEVSSPITKETEPISEVTITPLKSNEPTENTTETKTPISKTGLVKTTSYGTPVINIASSYNKLPSEDKFSKDICDVINFENLPDSTGKYVKICNLLKKVKTEVDRIHES